MKKRVYIIYTGGTIGMQPSSEGYTPAPGYLAEQIMSMPELKHELMPDVEIHEYDPLLDSANMTPEDWYKIAQDIGEHYDQSIVTRLMSNIVSCSFLHTKTRRTPVGRRVG